MIIGLFVAFMVPKTEYPISEFLTCAWLLEMSFETLILSTIASVQMRKHWRKYR